MKSSGTLGGYVRVREPSAGVDGKSTSTFHDRVYGVTNAHVLLDDNIIKTFQEIWWNRNNLPKKRPQMQSPSYQDCDGAVQIHQRWVESLEKYLVEYETRYANLQDSNDLQYDRLNDQIYRTKAKIAAGKTLISMARKAHPNLPVASMAFGKRNPNDNPEFKKALAMNVALIDVTDSVPSPESVVLPEDPLFSPSSGEIWTFWDTKDLTTEGVRADPRVLSIHGRTSGFSHGILHGIEVKIDLGLEERNGTKQYLSAYAILPLLKKHFSTKGDSGAFVFTGSKWGAENNPNTLSNDPPVVVGMIFADSESTGFGYFIPFDALVAEIESLTGGKVIWPSKRG